MQSGQYLLRKIVKQINYLHSQGIAVCLNWVPAHIGIVGNEKADGLAKQAAGSAGNGPRAVQPHYLRQLRSACKRITKTETRERWEHQWRHEAHGRIYRK
jgi:RNase H